MWGFTKDEMTIRSQEEILRLIYQYPNTDHQDIVELSRDLQAKGVAKILRIKLKK